MADRCVLYTAQNTLKHHCADITTVGWVFAAPWAGVDLDSFPNLKRWLDKVTERPAVKEGLDVPEPNQMKEMMADPEKMKKAIEDAQAMMVKH